MEGNMKFWIVAICVVLFLPQFVLSSLPHSICTIRYRNQTGVERISFDCGKTFQNVGAISHKNFYIVNWEKQDGIFQSLDKGKTWFKLRSCNEVESGSSNYYRTVKVNNRKLVVNLKESGDGIITIFNPLGNQIYNAPIHLSLGNNEINLPLQLLGGRLYFGTLWARGQTYFFSFVINN